MDDLTITRRGFVAAAAAAGAAASLAGTGALASEAADKKAAFKAGTYAATADGFHGPVTLGFTVSDTAIEDIRIIESAESLGAGATALETLSAAVLETQSLAVDSVSGATFTSLAFFTAAEDALAQAGADVSALQKPLESGKTDEVTTRDVDVVVVGSGIAGMAAAVSAAENGASVLVLEKLGLKGGNAKFSMGSFMYCQVPENADFHMFEDTADTLDQAKARWSDYQAESDNDSIYPDYDRLGQNLIQTMYTFDWMKNLGVTLTLDESFSETGRMSMAQSDVATDTSAGTPAAKVLQLFGNVVEEKGGEVLINTPVTELIIEDGKVTGVKADSPEGPLEVHAGAVILAAGGFTANDEMVAERLPFIDELFYSGARGATGDGIRMAEAAGAVPFEDAWIVPTFVAPSNKFYFANHYNQIFSAENSPLENVKEYTY